jgi:hypothetical protein
VLDRREEGSVTDLQRRYAALRERTTRKGKRRAARVERRTAVPLETACGYLLRSSVLLGDALTEQLATAA